MAFYRKKSNTDNFIWKVNVQREKKQQQKPHTQLLVTFPKAYINKKKILFHIEN